MGIINRDLDKSEQRQAYYVNSAATATGVTGIICHVPWPCSLDVAQMSAFGVSGSPTVALIANRFIPGVGVTAITVAVGTSNSVVAFGTSGVPANGFVMPAIGSTLTQLQANDVLMYQTGGANSAVTGLSVNVALRPIADYVKYYGII